MARTRATGSPGRTRLPKVFIAGAGAAGVALGRALREAGYPVVGVFRRRRNDAQSAARRVAAAAYWSVFPPRLAGADVVLVCVKDDAIEAVAHSLRPLLPDRRVVVLHVSGARGASALKALRPFARAIGAMHPLQTFAREAPLAGALFAIDGDPAAARVAARMAKDLGGVAVYVGEPQRALYHAAAAIVANGLVALVETAARLFAQTGIPRDRAVKGLVPLVRQVVGNVGALGIEGALSGPVARGDRRTVAAHLHALGRSTTAHRLYTTLAKVWISIARRKGSAKPADLRSIEKLLGAY